MALHFFKRLVLFAGMIAIGLLAVFFMNYFELQEKIPDGKACNEGEVC